MAKETPASLNNITIYQVYVRNHGPNGTFADVAADLDRIRSMNVDVVYFMPIHPIGVLNRKGTLGCPYSIRDYRAVNPEYGTLAEFRLLIDAIHARGMKVMIDEVFNHTAHDAIYITEHPDWYHRDTDGKPFTTVPEWSDVIDLKHPNPGIAGAGGVLAHGARALRGSEPGYHVAGRKHTHGFCAHAPQSWPVCAFGWRTLPGV